LTRVRLPLLGSARGPVVEAFALDAPIFEPLATDALLAPPGPLVLVAGARGARRAAAAAFSRALLDAGLRVGSLDEASVAGGRAGLAHALEALARDFELVVVEGNSSIGLYRATLSAWVGPVEAFRAHRALRGRADVEVEQPSGALLGALASVVAHAARGRR
jgi:hypothetical protein